MTPLTPAEWMFLQAIEELAARKMALEIGIVDSAASIALVKKYQMSRSRLDKMIAKLTGKGALERIRRGTYKIKIPSTKAKVTEGRLGRPFMGFSPSEKPDQCVRQSRKPEPPRREPLPPIPPDTRSLTGRLMGDPLPGRSALDRMRQEWCS